RQQFDPLTRYALHPRNGRHRVGAEKRGVLRVWFPPILRRLRRRGGVEPPEVVRVLPPPPSSHRPQRPRLRGRVLAQVVPPQILCQVRNLRLTLHRVRTVLGPYGGDWVLRRIRDTQKRGCHVSSPPMSPHASQRYTFAGPGAS